MARRDKVLLGPPSSSPDKSWMAEDDHRTLMRAAEVTSDPARMAGVKKHHKKVSRGLASVGKMMGSR
jgi:hypothetical protein